jgi:tellurite resistance protein TerC
MGVLGFWVCCGFAYNFLVFARQGTEKAVLWCSGYFLEWLLSMDNLFVFHLIFSVYATPKQLLHKALFMGILGAIVFRMVFFMALSSLLHLVHWFRFVFGALLIFSGIQAARGEDDETDISNLCAVRWLKWCLGGRLAEKYDLEEYRMFIVEDGKVTATLLVLVVLCLELTDLIFAVDSVSAKVAEIPDYYIAYSSSVLAMFGLRAMFFILSDLVDVFDMLKYGLCFILVFIGIELLVEDFVRLPTQVVCIIILAVFLVCTAGSTAKGLFKPPSP